MFAWIGLISISGLAHIIADAKHKWKLTYLFKPLTMLLMIALLVSHADIQQAYSRWILLALTLSALGDVFLMQRPQKFIAGLACFLLAHIVYVIAFVSQLTSWNLPLTCLWVLPLAIAYLALMWPRLGKLKFAVLLYCCAISLMIIAASALYWLQPSYNHQLLLSGAILFALSDGVLGYRKFVQEFELSQVFIMTTYYAAQLLIVFSVIS